MSWSNMSKIKLSGGLGFINLRDFNIALLGNQGWRLLRYPNKLVSKVYKSRYYPYETFLSTKILVILTTFGVVFLDLNPY